MVEVILSFFRLINEIFLKNKKNIHLVDDEKFIDFAIREFNEAENHRHLFLIVGEVRKLEFIKCSEVLIIHPRLMWYLMPFAKSHIKSVFFHSLSGNFNKNLILRIPKKIPIFWMSWGFDLIYIFGEAKNYVKPKTNTIISLNDQESLHGNVVTNYFQAFSTLSDPKKIVERIDYFSTVIEEEKEIINSNKFSKTPTWIPWNYFTLEEDVIKGFEDKEVTGDNILIGNSGNFWNNHLDAFTELLEFQIYFDKIVCPLSYGDQSYSNIVIKEGEATFGEKFIPLTEYLVYPEYVRLLLSCKFFFMNSLRQLGFGNLLLLLYLGSRVILDKTNPTYYFFLKNDIRVFSIEEAKSGHLENINLEKTRVNLNRIWGKDAIRKKTINVVKLAS